MEIKRITTTEELNMAFNIRTKVFIEEQGVPEEDEFDKYDRNESEAVHLLILQDDKPVGTGRIRFTEGYGKLERICVDKNYRSGGFGKEIIFELERIAKENKQTKVKLHGQTQAASFYQKLGYKICSDVFSEDGIDHFLMEKEW